MKVHPGIPVLRIHRRKAVEVHELFPRRGQRGIHVGGHGDKDVDPLVVPGRLVLHDPLHEFGQPFYRAFPHVPENQRRIDHGRVKGELQVDHAHGRSFHELPRGERLDRFNIVRGEAFLAHKSQHGLPDAGIADDQGSADFLPVLQGDTDSPPLFQEHLGYARPEPDRSSGIANHREEGLRDGGTPTEGVADVRVIARVGYHPDHLACRGFLGGNHGVEQHLLVFEAQEGLTVCEGSQPGAVGRVVQLKGLLVGHALDGLVDPVGVLDVLVAKSEGSVHGRPLFRRGERRVRVWEGLFVDHQHDPGLGRRVPPADGLRLARASENLTKGPLFATPEHVDEDIDHEPLFFVAGAPAANKGVPLQDGDLFAAARQEGRHGRPADAGSHDDCVRIRCHRVSYR